ncbi:fructosamine kinase family protein [Thermithiobacillus plumbiphilus]|uniref:Fructosamine kinase family protein n=1 Tax=Thermithiobacillus plumbiphilus TaxID=1729899 RepID=A0ABU9DC66_9PROT
MSLIDAIAAAIHAATGEAFTPRESRDLAGGCINEALLLDDGRRRFFVKLNRADLADMFEAEAEGLAVMAATQAIRVPRPVCSGVSGGQAYLVLEYIPLGKPGRQGGVALGQALAQMHRHVQPRFGWHRDNTIGSTPQCNDWQTDWTTFWRDQRLGFQLERAAQQGHGRELQTRGEKLLSCLPMLLKGHQPQASLLHGDLWSGNHAFDEHGAPVIFDPALYYGDRETDIAMTELFGGFPPDFYAAYREAWPLDAGYALRKTLYNLYHVLNHLNLFGGGYLAQARRMIDSLLAECR